MKTEWENYIKTLMEKLRGLGIFDEVEFGEPATIDRTPACYVIPLASVPVNVTPTVVEWDFHTLIAIVTFGSYVDLDTFFEAVEYVEKVIRIFENNPTLDGTIDTFRFEPIRHTCQAERIMFEIEVHAFRQTTEVT